LSFHHYKKTYVLFFKAASLLVGGLIVFVLTKKVSAHYQFEIPDMIYTIWTILILGIPIGKYSRKIENEWNRAKEKTKKGRKGKKGA